MARRAFFTAGGTGLVLALTACTSSDPLSDQANAGDNKNYIAGDGTVSEYSVADRKDPVEFSGTLFDGSTVDASNFAGHVTVLNFWFASCAPCRIEAPVLQELYTELAPEGVQFLGVNIRDKKPAAEAFERNFQLSYPSITDTDGNVLLSLTKFVPPTSVPTTLVLDQQGRVSARVIGAAQKSTLKALIISVLAEA